MESVATLKSHRMLLLNTLAFTVCFAAWMFNGVLVTFLVDNQLFDWTPVQVGWLFGIPVLTGSIFRLPAGMLTDKFGGRPVFGGLLLASAIPMFFLSRADGFASFAVCSFLFGMTGVSFSIGIAFTSVWYPRRLQGTALGIFGAGNAGAAITTLLAPTLLSRLTRGGEFLEGWRQLPVWYAAALAATGIAFLALSENKKPASSSKSLGEMMQPLRSVRVWRFGLYYFLVFGCFVAFSQWLVPYFVNVYTLSLVTAGIFAASFSFPSGVIRALGGWMSDRWGARAVMYWVLGLSTLISAMLVVPRMEIYSPGQGVMARRAGVVTAVSPTVIEIDGVAIPLAEKPSIENDTERFMVWPAKQVWQEPMVAAGDQVVKRQLLARGVTRIYFQANVWIFAGLVMLLGVVWGVGKAAVYKYIPDYFPEQVGVVGGMVGVLGGLGGFVCPIVFGYLLQTTGLWTSCWMFMFAVSVTCLAWLHLIVRRIERESPVREIVRARSATFEVAPAAVPVDVRP